MSAPGRPILLALFVSFGALGWLAFYSLLHGTLGQDWMVFDTAARAYWHGDTSVLLDGVHLTRVLNDTHPSLSRRLDFRPWVYPPYTLLLVLPFGLLPWALSYGGFQVLSFAAMAAALRPWVAGWRRYAAVLAGTALCPASGYTMGAGQNSFLSAALLMSGTWLLETRPFAAGLVLGGLAFKPQLGLLVPVALLAAGAWRAIGGAAAMVTVLVGTSLAVPGVAIWRGWLALFLHGGGAPRDWVELYGQSVFTVLRLAHVPPVLANLGQIGALLVGAAATWRAFSRRGAWLQKLLVLLCATSFAAPHFGDYDAVLLGLCAMLLLQSSAAGGWLAFGGALAWCSTAINPPYLFAQTIHALFYVSELTPVLIAVLLWGLVERLGGDVADVYVSPTQTPRHSFSARAMEPSQGAKRRHCSNPSR